MADGHEFHIEPKKFRLFFMTLLLVGLLVIWSAYVIGIHFEERSEEENLKNRIEIDTLMFEDHVSRTLDALVARLKSVSAITTPTSLREGRLSSEMLYKLISEDHVIRSISLVDDSGRVVTSSLERNEGKLLPAGLLPDDSGRLDIAEVRFGQVFQNRDLYDMGSSVPSGDVKFWVATAAVPMGQKMYHWVAVINLGFFKNLWARIDNEEATEIGMFDYQGQHLISYHAAVPYFDKVVATIVNTVKSRQRGFFDFGDDHRLMVAYRTSLTHPVILAIAGDRQRLFAQRAKDRQFLAIVAVIASLLVFAVLGVLYRWYLRYEASVIEMANQTRAISAHLMVSESAQNGKIIRVSDTFLEASGYSRDEVIGQYHGMFNSGLYSREFYKDLWNTVSSGNIWKGIFRNRKKEGGYYWVNATIVPFTDAWGKVSRYVCFYSDITEAIALSEKLDHEYRLREELSQVNRNLVTDLNTDPLTGVANRRALDSFTLQAIAPDRKLTQPMSVMMLDLDKFKSINDTYGHGAGDAVLREVARRWTQQIRASDMLARLGGEEFCVVLPHTTSAKAQRVAEKLRTVTAATPVEIIYNETPLFLNVTVSIGLVSTDWPQHLEVKSLLQVADEALYEAKRGGRNRVASRRAV
jgi:diguanylate cyclase (GGDEF)-like protein/PAS domain S-box-containing protein